jgi:hypothetical protein
MCAFERHRRYWTSVIGPWSSTCDRSWRVVARDAQPLRPQRMRITQARNSRKDKPMAATL